MQLPLYAFQSTCGVWYPHAIACGSGGSLFIHKAASLPIIEINSLATLVIGRQSQTAAIACAASELQD